MTIWQRCVLAVFAGSVLGCASLKDDLPVGDEVDFVRHIKPVLEDRCVKCHNRRSMAGAHQLRIPRTGDEAGGARAGDRPRRSGRQPAVEFSQRPRAERTWRCPAKGTRCRRKKSRPSASGLRLGRVGRMVRRDGCRRPVPGRELSDIQGDPLHPSGSDLRIAGYEALPPDFCALRGALRRHDGLSGAAVR